MTAPTQNCGLCRWWGGRMLPLSVTRAACLAPIPDSVVLSQREATHFTYGTTCPTYAPKQGGEETRS